MNLERGRHYNPVMLRSLVLIVAGLMVAMSGCTPSIGVETVTENAGPPQSREAPGAKPSPRVEILSWDQTQKRRELFKGKVVVLDVWSTYCDPCLREFPNLVALQQRFGDKVRCFSFNTDYSGAKDEPAESFRPQVLKFLTKQKADLINVISSDPSEEFYSKIKLGGPPAVFVYNREGNLAKRFDSSSGSTSGEFTYKKDVAPFVEKLLIGTK